MNVFVRLSKIMLGCACLVTLSAGISTPSAEAQAPIIIDPYSRNRFTLELLLPQLDENLVGEYGSSGLVAGARFGVGKDTRFVLEVPVFFISSEGQFVGVQPNGQPIIEGDGNTTLLGNVLLGAEFGNAQQLEYSIALRLPTYNPDNPYVGLGGAFVDPFRIGQAGEGAIGYRAHVKWLSDSTKTTRVLLRGGLQGLIATDTLKSASQLFLDLEPALRLGSEKFAVILGANIVTQLSSPVVDAFEEWSAMFNLGVYYDSGAFNPGIHVRLPAGENLRPIDLIIGLSIAIAPF